MRPALDPVLASRICARYSDNSSFQAGASARYLSAELATREAAGFPQADRGWLAGNGRGRCSMVEERGTGSKEDARHADARTGGRTAG